MNLTVLIGEEEYQTDSRYSIREQAGATSSSSIDVRVAQDQPIPRALQKVTISLDSSPFFFGIIDSIDSPEYSSGYEVPKYRLNLSSGTKILQWRRVNEAYQDKTTQEIVQDIFTNYIETEGIELGSISACDHLYSEYIANYDLTVKDVLDELADDCGASYYIGPDEKFYFIIRSELEISDAPGHITKVTLEERASDVRTVQTVLGASEETSQQNYGAAWLSGQDTITLGYQISAILSATIEGSPVGFGIIGLDEEDTAKTFLYTPGKQTVTVNANAITKPTTGDLVGLVYTGYYDIIITNENSQLLSDIANLSGTSGRIESVLSDETLTNFADADAKANALLSENGTIEQVIQCTFVGETSLADTELLKAWRFNLVDQGIVGTYAKTERTIEDFLDKFRVRVKLSNAKLSSRYGTTLTGKTKKVRPDTLIYKQSIANDTMVAMDAFVFDSAGVLQFPTSGSYGTIFEPGLPGFYPV